MPKTLRPLCVQSISYLNNLRSIDFWFTFKLGRKSLLKGPSETFLFMVLILNPLFSILNLTVFIVLRCSYTCYFNKYFFSVDVFWKDQMKS